MVLNNMQLDLLEKILNEQNAPNPNMSNLSPTKCGLEMKQYATIVDHLQKGGLIDGAVVQYGGDDPGPIFASLGSATVTLLGQNVLAESKKL